MIYFYSTHEEPYGCFSNFSAQGIALDGAWWPTVEHYFQAQKFVGTANTTYGERIRRATTPKQAATLGRSRQIPLRPDWEEVKDDVMLRAVQCKFETHERLRKLLLSTGDEEIIEASPSDYYWGCGADGSGRNQLGRLLMLVRSRLRQTAVAQLPKTR
ncbi:MAG: NADAR family protein [Ktedonobacterales bacterium]